MHTCMEGMTIWKGCPYGRYVLLKKLCPHRWCVLIEGAPLWKVRSYEKCAFMEIKFLSKVCPHKQGSLVEGVPFLKVCSSRCPIILEVSFYWWLQVCPLVGGDSKLTYNSLVSSIKENTQCHILLNQWLFQSSSSPWIIYTIGSISFHFSQSIVDGSSPQRVACCFQNSIILYIVKAHSPVIIPHNDSIITITVLMVSITIFLILIGSACINLSHNWCAILGCPITGIPFEQLQIEYL